MKQAGVTLVELLVSLALGSLTMVTAMQFLAGGLRVHADVSALTHIHDKAHHAMSLFGNAVKRAGYLGCGGRSATLVSLLRTDMASTAELDLFEPYAIHEADGQSPRWIPDLTDLPMRVGRMTRNAIDGRNAIRRETLVPGNDLLVVRGLGFGAREVIEAVDSGGSLRVASRRGIGNGDFVALTDCEHIEIQRIHRVRASRGGWRLSRLGGSGTFDNHPLRLQDSHAFTSSWLLPVETEFLYIAESQTAPEYPALWRKQTQRRARELIEGIAELEISALLGVEGRALGLRVSFIAASAPTDQPRSLERRFIRHFAFHNL